MQCNLIEIESMPKSKKSISAKFDCDAKKIFFFAGLHFASPFFQDPLLWNKFNSRWPLLLSMMLLNRHRLKNTISTKNTPGKKYFFAIARSADEFDEEEDGNLAAKIRDFYLSRDGDEEEEEEEELKPTGEEEKRFGKENEEKIVQVRNLPPYVI